MGALEYPAEFRVREAHHPAGLSKIITLTSTYDHRVIQGAGSGEFLKLVEHYLLGGDDFYDAIFRDLKVPFEPVRWARDNHVDDAHEISKVARIQQLIHAYRVHVPDRSNQPRWLQDAFAPGPEAGELRY